MAEAQPTAGQKEAGNYQKGHLHLLGMRLSIENPAGSTRSGTDPDGNAWSQELKHDYGYIRGTQGRDKDHIDVFLGPNHKDATLPVHVVDQLNPDGEFDEHKVVLGAKTPEEASEIYHANYEPGWRGLGDVTALPLGAFKQWAFAEGRRVKPLAEHSAAEGAGSEGYAKGGTVAAQKPAAKPATPPAATNTSPGYAPQYAPTPAERLADALSSGYTLGYPGAVAAMTSGSGPYNVLDADIKLGGVGAPPNYAGGGAVDPQAEAGQNFLRSQMPAPGQAVPGTEPTGEAANIGAFLSRVFGGEPDAGSVLEPGHEALQKAADYGGLAGDVANLLPVIGPAVRGLGAVGRGGAALIDAAMHGEGPLAKVLAPAAPAFAVKPKGGNWYGGGLPEMLQSVKGNATREPIADWVDNNLQRYVKTYLGTAEDPLLKLEQQGQLHLSPARIEELNTQGYGKSLKRTPEGDYVGADLTDTQLHHTLTGRATRTPWENLADAQLNPIPVSRLTGAQREPWMDKLPPDAQLQTYTGPSDLGFDHVRDYLNAAVNAHVAKAALGAEVFANHPAMSRERAVIAHGLQLDPARLSSVSVPDAVAKTAQWNAMLAKQQAGDLSAGVKSVLKNYPDTGHSWVELSPEGLQAEGAAMKHCVGGYCSQVQDGSSRILSLRDVAGKPQVTVEVTPGEPNAIQQIKGPSNRAPSAAALPAVQDLVRGGVPGLERWGSVKDLNNAQMYDTRRGEELEHYMMASVPAALRNDRQLALGRARMSGALRPYMTRAEWEAALTPHLPATKGYASGGTVQPPPFNSGLGITVPQAQGSDVMSTFNGGAPAPAAPSAPAPSTQPYTPHYYTNPGDGQQYLANIDPTLMATLNARAESAGPLALATDPTVNGGLHALGGGTYTSEAGSFDSPITGYMGAKNGDNTPYYDTSGQLGRFANPDKSDWSGLINSLGIVGMAFGGGGLLGGALGAGGVSAASLGMSPLAFNALTSAGSAALMGGNPVTGALGSLGGSFGGQLGSQLAGPVGGRLGSTLGSWAATGQRPGVVSLVNRLR